MYNKIIGVVVLSMMVGLSLLPVSAKASTIDSTGATIGFSDGNDVIVPGPYDDVLSLVARPTAFDFGASNKSSNSAQVYNQQITGEDQHVAIYDDRAEAEHTAWHVTAKMKDLSDISGTSLDSSISFNSEKIEQFKIDKVDGMLPNTLPEISGLTAYAGADVTGVSRVVLEAGGAEKHMMVATDAADNEGFAATIKNVQLKVIGNQQAKLKAAKTFTSSVLWSVNDEP